MLVGEQQFFPVENRGVDAFDEVCACHLSLHDVQTPGARQGRERFVEETGIGKQCDFRGSTSEPDDVECVLLDVGQGGRAGDQLAQGLIVLLHQRDMEVGVVGHPFTAADERHGGGVGFTQGRPGAAVSQTVHPLTPSGASARNGYLWHTTQEDETSDIP